jgi:hypothetical protein
MMKNLKTEISKEMVEKLLDIQISDAEWREFVMDREEEWAELAVKAACDMFKWVRTGEWWAERHSWGPYSF